MFHSNYVFNVTLCVNAIFNLIYTKAMYNVLKQVA